MIADRLRSQLLSGPPARDPLAATERLLAIQGQDPRGARLAIRARTRGLTAADVDRALTDDRSLLITWLNRGTLHLVRSDDYPWLHALTTPQLGTGVMRRLAQEGVEPAAADRAVAVVERSLSEEGPLTRAELGERLAARRLRTEGQALIHTLALASLRGLVVRGPMRGRQHAYVLVRDWLPPPGPVDRDRALAELARRYLAGHGPAGDRDLARWAGVPLRDARAGLSAIASELRQREDGLVELAGRRRVRALPPPRLLGSFEPVLLAWASRDFLFDRARTLVVDNGLLRPFALVEGRTAATWRLTGGKVEIEPFASLSGEDAAALEADAADVVRFLGVG